MEFGLYNISAWYNYFGLSKKVISFRTPKLTSTKIDNCGHYPMLKNPKGFE